MFINSALLFFCLFGGVLLLVGFILGRTRLLNCLVMLENFNVLLLFICLWSQVEDFRMLFLALMVIFTVEVTLSLVVLSRIWRLSDLAGFTGA